MCNCKDVKSGEYSNQIWVHSPIHMPKDNGYCLDLCIAEEVMSLWRKGIITTGCCCGHGDINKSFIGVSDEFIPLMIKFGYDTRVNCCDKTRRDSFIPRFKTVD